MSIVTLRNEIEAVINTISDCTYLRANENEANKALNKIKVSACLCIHSDRTDVTATRSQVGNYIYKEVPTEIYFVYKNTRIDDKQADVDILVSQAELKADEFYDKIIQSAIINDMAELPGYTLTRLDAFKRFDAVLSGVLFKCDLHIHRNYYYCNGD